MVIARYSLPKALPVITVSLLGIAGFGWLLFLNQGSWTDLMHAKPQWIPFYVIGLLACGYLGILALMILKQIVFRRGAAIWIDESELVYQGLGARRTSVSAIESVKASTFSSFGFRVGTIVLQLKGGQTRIIGAGLLSQAASIVANEVKAAVSEYNSCMSQ